MNDTTKIKEKPDFNFDSIELGDIKTDVEQTANVFPVEAFPRAIQNIIHQTNSTLGFPVEYVSAGILTVASTAIGNSLKALVKNNWSESCTIYGAIVGSPGLNKTASIKWTIQPLFEHDSASYQEYKTEKKTFDELSAMSKKERIEGGYPDPVKPCWKKFIVSDFTPEALVKSHSFNPRSLVVYADEILSWINNFGRYNNSSEGQFWLSNFSAAPLTIERKSDEPIRIQNPFINVVGGIQPSVLHELAAESRSNNGFLDRILFFYPDTVERESWNDNQLDEHVYWSWKKIVKKLMDIPCNMDESTGMLQSKLMKFSPDAWEVLTAWQKENTDKINDSDERTQSIYSKLELFCIRFALILQALKFAADEGTLDVIETDITTSAIKLTEYFRHTALKVSKKVNGQSFNKRRKDDLIALLPDQFTTNEGWTIAESKKVNKRTFERWLTDEAIFMKIEHGKYKKI